MGTYDPQNFIRAGNGTLGVCICAEQTAVCGYRGASGYHQYRLTARLFIAVQLREYFVMKEVPIRQKANLTLEEAAAYSGIGTGRLREINNGESCNFVL